MPCHCFASWLPQAAPLNGTRFWALGMPGPASTMLLHELPCALLWTLLRPLQQKRLNSPAAWLPMAGRFPCSLSITLKAALLFWYSISSNYWLVITCSSDVLWACLMVLFTLSSAPESLAGEVRKSRIVCHDPCMATVAHRIYRQEVPRSADSDGPGTLQCCP